METKMTTTTIDRPTKTNTHRPQARERAGLTIELANLRDELELFGWSAADTGRYARQALKALPIGAVIDLFRELVAEERGYYSQHATLADDQLDHTFGAA
jgi:hypothetical protein